MDATYKAVFVSGNRQEVVEMKFRDCTWDDIRYHIRNVYEEKTAEGYTLERYELTGGLEDERQDR